MGFFRKNNRRATLSAATPILVAVFALSVAPFVAALAAAPDAISYQGRLLNANGVPVTDASLEFVFRLFDASSGGTCLWESDDGAACDGADETQTVALTDGLFSENIGSAVDPDGLSEAYPVDLAGVFEGGTEVWLEVVVDGETLTPRKQLVAAPYALDAQALDGMDSTDFLAAAGDTATGIFDYTGAVISGASPFSFEGATANDFEATFAVADPTADRTIAFQDASGTVAYLSDISAGASLWESGAFATFEDDDDVVIGTSGGETIGAIGFSLGGDDLFVAGDIGVEGTAYSDTGFNVSGSIFDTDELVFAADGTLEATGGTLSIGSAVEIIVTTSQFEPNGMVDLGDVGAGWDDVYVDVGGTAIGLEDTASAVASGAFVIGANDEFANSSGTNVQDVLDDLDAAISSGGSGSLWTLSGGVAYLTSATGDFAIGGTTAAGAAFGVDESANGIFVGDGSSGNGTVVFKASDADTGSVAYSTGDRWEFTGGDVFVGSTSLSGVNGAFSPNGNDLFVAGDIGAQSNVYADTFTAGDASTTIGDGYLTTTGATDFLFTIAGGDLTFAQNTTIGDGGDTIAIDSSDWDISAAGNLSNVGSVSMDGNYSQSGATTFSTGTGAVLLNGAVTAGSTLAVAGASTLTGALTANGGISADGGAFTVADTSGAVHTGGTLDVDGASDLGGDIAFSAATPTLAISDAETLTITDGTNNLFTLADGGTAGNATITGSLVVTGATTLSGALTLNAAFSATGSVSLGDGDDTVSINSSDWDVSATGDMSNVGSISMDGNYSQSGATSFSTGTGAVLLNGAVTAGSTLAVTGAATLSSTLAVTGATALTGALTANGSAAFNSDVDITVDGTENVVIGNGTGTGSNGVDILTVNVINTDAGASTQRGLVVANLATSTATTESLIAADNADALAVADGLIVTGSGGAVTDGVDVSDSSIVNAINAGDNVVLGTAAQIDFTDFDVSADGLIAIAPDGGGVGFTISPSAAMTAGIDFANTNVGTEFLLQNDELVRNTVDGIISFGGGGGADNTDLSIDLDGTEPVIFSNNDSVIGFEDNVKIDPSSGNATIDLYASDGDTGSISYTTSDAFSFTGGDFGHTGTATLPTTLGGAYVSLQSSATFSGTSSANLDAVSMTGGQFTVSSSAAEGGGAPGTRHDLYGMAGYAFNSSSATGQARNIIGALGSASNLSTNATAVDGYMAGVSGLSVLNSAGVTVPDVRALSGLARVDAGTATGLFAVRGEVESGSGSATTSYGGYFSNIAEGATRYGLYVAASGGTADSIAGFFHSARVQIDTNGTVSTPSGAPGAGDLFVGGARELDGESVDTGTIMDISTSALTTGLAMSVQRTSSGTDFTNTTTGLVGFGITDTASTGNVLILANSGTGTSLFVDANADTGSTVSDTDGGAVHIANTGNSDFGLTVYTDDGTTTNSLAYFFNDNSAFDSYVVDIRSDATALGSANGTALHVLQEEIDSPGANSVGTQAIVIDTNEDIGDAGGSMSDAMILVREDVDGTPDTVFRVDGDGDVWADGTYGSGAADVAEIYPSDDTLVAGDLVVMDPAGTGVLRSASAYEAGVVGGVSTLPGVLLGFEEPGYKIALAGRIPLKVTAENGVIAAGDPIVSSSTAGHGMRATEPGMIVGFALEGFAGPGNGTVSVFVAPQFYMGTIVSTDGNVTEINDDVELAGRFAVLGSGGGAEAKMELVTDVTDATDYRLSIENGDGSRVAYVSNVGDLAIAGRFYPSDRGALQTSKYIYYDGSSGMGGDFMRTNASGWATGSYDFAEMFPSADALEPGDVVVFGESDESVARSAESSDLGLAGIVSTRPGFLAGENADGHYPIALAGRVPTKVTDENGAIAVGDPLTSSSRGGYAMKATRPGPIVGYALEPFDGGEDDKIVAFVNVSYWDGTPAPALPGTNNAASTIVVTQNADNLTSLNMNGNVYMTGNDVVGVRRVEGIAGRWSIEEDGTVRTLGTLKAVTESYQGERVETAAITSPDVMVTLVGTGTLRNGEAVIRFEDVNASFNDITALNAPIRVVVTPNGPVSLYVFEKDNDGFGVRQVGGDNDGVTFDWMVSAYRKGYEPEEEPTEEIAETKMEPEGEPVETTEDSVAAENEQSTETPTDQPAKSAPEVLSAPSVLSVSPSPEEPVTFVAEE
jgi:hypothetical protein